MFYLRSIFCPNSERPYKIETGRASILEPFLRSISNFTVSSVLALFFRIMVAFTLRVGAAFIIVIIKVEFKRFTAVRALHFAFLYKVF